MKEYPYISIILYEYWTIKRKSLIEEEMFTITGVAEVDRVYGVRFMKTAWEGEHMLDLPVEYYKERLRHYTSLEREGKLKELGI